MMSGFPGFLLGFVALLIVVSIIVLAVMFGYRALEKYLYDRGWIN